MKVICSAIIVFLLLFGTIFLPNHACAVICQNKTAIVYGNGMFNNKVDAEESLSELEVKLRAYPQASNLLAELEFHLAYADNAGATGPWSLTGVGQLVEIVRQGGNNNYVSMWRWLSDIEAAPQWFQNDMTRIAAAQNALSYVNDVDLQKMLNGDGTANNPGYRKLLLGGKRVLIVSHSQGNFYANAVYNTLNDPLNPRYANSMGNVQVATPASYVASGGPYTTVPEDAAMAFVVGKLPPSGTVSSLPYNLLPYSLMVSPNFGNLGYSAWARASKGHSFINWYLAWSYTRDRIMGHIVKTINGVNGVGGLQYPTQGCTPPVAGPVVTVPQLGPYYFRDDWGMLTFDLSVLELRGKGYSRDPWGRFKNLRDGQKGLAYHVDMMLTLINPTTKTWGFPVNSSITITDYSSLEKQTVALPFTGSFYPQDVLLWNGGLIFLSFDNNHWFGSYRRDDIVRVSWRKVSIIDKGAGVPVRWAFRPVQSGTFTMPAYTVTQPTWATTPAGGSFQKWGAGSKNQWNRLGVAYRDGMTYTYRIPFSASEANWINPPSTPFGWVNGVQVTAPDPALKIYTGDYGVLEVVDGAVSFTPLGSSLLQSTGTQQSGIVPKIVNSFGGIVQSRAYQATQNIVQKALLVDEADQPYWRMAGNPPAAGAPPLGMLKAALPANELFFNPKTWTQPFSGGFYGSYTYGQVFVPFSLSSQMAGMTTSGINSPKLSQPSSSYKLGKRFAYSYKVAPIPIPGFGRSGQHLYCGGNTIPCFPGTIYGVSVDRTQKAFMMSPAP